MSGKAWTPTTSANDLGSNTVYGVWLLSDPAELPGSLRLAESWLAAVSARGRGGGRGRGAGAGGGVCAHLPPLNIPHTLNCSKIEPPTNSRRMLLLGMASGEMGANH